MITSLHRERREVETPHVTHMELFFDLVFVFAFIQLSHHLLEHLSLQGSLEAVVLFLGVWWAWNYTTWAANWVNPDRPPVRAMMVVLMFLSLLMAIAVPQAFGDRGMLFAVAYVLLQLIRSAFMVVAFGFGHRMGRNYTQLLAWSAIAGVGWIAGAFADDPELRLLIWAIAVIVDYAAPMHGFALPGMGRTPIADWDLAGGHLAERFHLVVIIALGESILEMGLTLSGITLTGSVSAAFAIGFVLTVSLWWMYFIRHADATVRALIAADDPARIGRSGFAYGHAVMVAGIIVIAVAIAEVLHHPTGDTPTEMAVLLLAGPAVYLAGNAWFNYALACQFPSSRAYGILALAVLAPFSTTLPPLALLSAVAAVIVALALSTGTPKRPGRDAGRPEEPTGAAGASGVTEPRGPSA